MRSSASGSAFGQLSAMNRPLRSCCSTPFAGPSAASRLSGVHGTTAPRSTSSWPMSSSHWRRFQATRRATSPPPASSSTVTHAGGGSTPRKLGPHDVTGRLKIVAVSSRRPDWSVGATLGFSTDIDCWNDRRGQGDCLLAPSRESSKRSETGWSLLPKEQRRLVMVRLLAALRLIVQSDGRGCRVGVLSSRRYAERRAAPEATRLWLQAADAALLG
jgi:hypothetical protein